MGLGAGGWGLRAGASASSRPIVGVDQSNQLSRLGSKRASSAGERTVYAGFARAELAPIQINEPENNPFALRLYAVAVRGIAGEHQQVVNIGL